MRKAKWACVVVLNIVLILILLFALYTKQQFANRPVNQPFTKWVSEDETIVFEIDANGAGCGTMIIQGEILDIRFATGLDWDIGVYVITEDGCTELVEMWVGRFNKADRFIAVVSDKTTYFKKGDRIAFHRVHKQD